MAFFYLEDHLDGFDKNYFNSTLSNMESDGSNLYTEYILPNEVKKKYKNINLKFSAWLMVKNNHYANFIDIKPRASTDRDNFLCTFNRSSHRGRINFVLALISAGLFDPKYSSKCFSIPHKHWLDFAVKFPLATIAKDIDLDSIRDLLDSEFHQGTLRHPGATAEDNGDFANIISQSFITAVCEPIPDSHVPFPTEKICYPIVNNSLWLAYAQPGYYKWIEEHMGIVRFEGICYDFDNIEDPIERLHEYTQELLNLQKLFKEDKNYLYQKNEKIIQHNYDLVTSGRLIANLWHYDDLCQETDMPEIDHGLPGLIKQLMLAMRSRSHQKRIT